MKWSGSFDWDDAAIARLRALWAEGILAGEIGHQLGCSKNAVVGKAHRIGLPGRPSPIPVGKQRTRAPKIPAAPKVTLPPIVHTPTPPSPLALLLRSERTEPRPALTPGAHACVVRTCQFPMWGNGRPTHVYCGVPVERDAEGVPTGPYCAACAERCYVRVRVREEAA